MRSAWSWEKVRIAFPDNGIGKSATDVVAKFQNRRDRGGQVPEWER